MKETLELIRGAVRPILTLGFAIAFIAACFCNLEDSAFSKLEAITFIVVGWWFRDHAIEKLVGNGHGAPR